MATDPIARGACATVDAAGNIAAKAKGRCRKRKRNARDHAATERRSDKPPFVSAGRSSEVTMIMEPGITIGEKYEPAMTISDQAEADAYFERCVEHTLLCYGGSREQAERLERANLGYFAGYYDHETRERVERLFRCVHPIFGSIAKNGPPTAAEALLAGVQAGADALRNSRVRILAAVDGTLSPEAAERIKRELGL